MLWCSRSRSAPSRPSRGLGRSPRVGIQPRSLVGNNPGGRTRSRTPRASSARRSLHGIGAGRTGTSGLRSMVPPSSASVDCKCATDAGIKASSPTPYTPNVGVRELRLLFGHQSWTSHLATRAASSRGTLRSTQRRLASVLSKFGHHLGGTVAPKDRAPYNDALGARAKGNGRRPKPASVGHIQYGRTP
jgi:hypothetical protein